MLLIYLPDQSTIPNNVLGSLQAEIAQKNGHVADYSSYSIVGSVKIFACFLYCFTLTYLQQV